MDKKDWQKVLRDIKARFKAEGKVPSSKKPMSVTGNDGFISYPAAEDQIKVTKKRLFNSQPYKPLVSDLGSTRLTKEQERLAKRQLFAGTRWHRRGPRFCAYCWRLFLPQRKEQIYHGNVCAAFVKARQDCNGILNAVEFLPAKTLREIGGTVLLPRAYVILFLIAAVEIRLRYRMVRTTTIRLWYKLRGKQQEVYNPWD